jgi:uncharacterized protein YuzB (UPF0349 family)
MSFRRTEPDPSLRRIERDALLMCGVTAAAAFVVGKGDVAALLGVVAGTALMAASYVWIRHGVDALVSRASPDHAAVNPPSTPAIAWTFVRFVGRYGLIAVAAWIVLVPLGASPSWLFAGVTVPVVAIGIEAIRLVRLSSVRVKPPGRQ